MLARLIGALTLLSSCTSSPTTSPSPPPDPSPIGRPDGGVRNDQKAGSRLSPSVIVLRGADATLERPPQALSPVWLDSELHERCIPRLFADQRTRCAPFARPVTSRVDFYLDPSCTQPVWGYPIDAHCNIETPPLSARYVELPTSTFCAARLAVLDPSAQRSLTTVYSRSTTNCVAQNTANAYDWYIPHNLPELAPSQLVEFQVIEAPAAQPWDIASSGTRVQARFTLYRGDDGSEGWAFKGLLDQERSEWCKVGSLTDGSLHCAPKGMTPTMGPHYSDPSCAKLAMEVPKSLGCQQDSRLRPYLAEPVVVEGCARQRTYDYPLSPLGQLYDNSSGTCAEVPLPDHTDAFVETATPEIFPSAFVAATEVSSDSPAEILSGQRLTGRRWRHRGFDGFTTWLRDELIDTVRAEPCSPNLFEDGRFHCVPSFDEVILGADEILYADAQCSQSVVGVLPRSACYPSTRYVSFPVTVRGCPAVRLALRSDVSTTVSQLYVRRLGQCVEDTSTDPSLCAFFAVSRRFDPSDFVELSPAWEP